MVLVAGQVKVTHTHLAEVARVTGVRVRMGGGGVRVCVCVQGCVCKGVCVCVCMRACVCMQGCGMRVWVCERERERESADNYPYEHTATGPDGHMRGYSISLAANC